MYLTFTAMGLAFACGWCVGTRQQAQRGSEDELILRWLARFLGLAAIIFLAIGLTVSCASSRSGKALNVGVLAAGAADLHATQGAQQRGGREVNPIVGHRLLQQALVKTGGVGLVIGLAALAESKQKPVVAQIVRVMAITAWSVMAVHNYQTGRR